MNILGTAVLCGFVGAGLYDACKVAIRRSKYTATAKVFERLRYSTGKVWAGILAELNKHDVVWRRCWRDGGLEAIHGEYTFRLTPTSRMTGRFEILKNGHKEFGWRLNYSEYGDSVDVRLAADEIYSLVDLAIKDGLDGVTRATWLSDEELVIVEELARPDEEIPF